MATIISSDIIFARILMGCRELGSLRLSGMASPMELMSRIKSWLVMNGHAGSSLLTLDLRNQSQGWSVRRAIMA